MDLGLKGRKAIVCASSKGLGRACAEALAEAGCDLVLNGRNEETLATTAEAIRKTFGVKVDAVVAARRAQHGELRPRLTDGESRLLRLFCAHAKPPADSMSGGDLGRRRAAARRPHRFYSLVRGLTYCHNRQEIDDFTG